MRKIFDSTPFNVVVLAINSYFAFHDGAVLNAVAVGFGICLIFNSYDKKTVK